MKKIITRILMAGIMLSPFSSFADFKEGVELYKNKNFTAAFAVFLEEANKNNDKNAMSLLGSMYFSGLGVSIDYQKSAYWLQKAADEGDKVSNLILGGMFEQGLGVKQDITSAIGHYTVAASLNDKNGAKAFRALGKIYDDGILAEKNVLKAIEYWKKGVKLGDAESAYNLGQIYSLPKNKKYNDFELAFKYYEYAANAGIPSAQNSLAVAYMNGRGTNKSDLNAFQWFQKAAEGGDIEAQNSLAGSYHGGIGVERDIEAAKF